MSRVLKPLIIERVATAAEVGVASPLAATDRFVIDLLVLQRTANSATVPLGCLNDAGVATTKEELAQIAQSSRGDKITNLKDHYMTAAAEGDGVIIFGYEES